MAMLTGVLTGGVLLALAPLCCCGWGQSRLNISTRRGVLPSQPSHTFWTMSLTLLLLMMMMTTLMITMIVIVANNAVM